MNNLIIYIFSISSLFFYIGCNSGGGSSSTATTSTQEAPAVANLVGSEIAFNPIINFTTSSDCTYDNTFAIESTFPKPSGGAITASYTALKNGDTITITISSTDSSFGEDLVLVMSSWSDLDGDNIIDQFSVLATLGDDSPLAAMTGEFTSNPPPLPNVNLNFTTSPSFVGGDANRSPTLAEWNNYVVGKQLVFLYLDGNITALSISSASAYTTTDSSGKSLTGTYDYDMVSVTKGRLTLYEKSTSNEYDYVKDAYGNSVAAYESEMVTKSENRTVIIDLNFYNTDQLYNSTYDALYDKPGGLGIHFLRTSDQTITVSGTTSTTSSVTLSGNEEGSLRVYRDSSLLK